MQAEYKILVDYLVQHGARKVSVFGSRARNDFRNDSDLDIIVEFTETPSLLAFVKMERELSETTGFKVDLLTEKSINPLILQHIKKDRILLYQ